MDIQTILILTGVIVIILILRLTSVKKAPTYSKPIQISPQNSGAIMSLIANNQLIEAIKIVRQEQHCSLKEAKDYVEALKKGVPTAMPNSKLISTSKDLSASTEASVKALIQKGEIIEAIKIVRSETGLDLKGAKDYVDKLL